MLLHELLWYVLDPRALHEVGDVLSEVGPEVWVACQIPNNSLGQLVSVYRFRRLVREPPLLGGLNPGLHLDLYRCMIRHLLHIVPYHRIGDGQVDGPQLVELVSPLMGCLHSIPCYSWLESHLTEVLVNLCHLLVHVSSNDNPCSLVLLEDALYEVDQLHPLVGDPLFIPWL